MQAPRSLISNAPDTASEATPSPEPAPLWLAIHLPYLGLELFHRRAADADPNQPTVLLDDNRVIVRNRAARQLRIAVGSSLATAHSISTDLTHYNRDIEGEQSRLHFLAQALYRFTPQVSTADPLCLLLEVRGSIRLFGGLQPLIRQVLEVLRAFGHYGRPGAAQTPLAAQALSRFQSHRLDRYPSAEDWVAAGRKVLRDAPLSYLGLPLNQCERFANMGLRRIGQILDLPLKELGKRFDRNLTTIVARLRGDLGDPRQPILPVQRFRSGIHLLESLSNHADLLKPMQQLLADLGAWLLAHRLSTLGLVWEFSTLRGQRETLAIRFTTPRHDPQSMLLISKLKLEHSTLPNEIMSVRLSARSTLPSQERYTDLLGDDLRSNRDDNGDLIDSLSARLGEAALQCIHAANDHRPEFAWLPGTHRLSATDAPTSFSPHRPLWLLEPPRAISPDGLTLLAGPERLETGWWDEHGVRRDYYIAAENNGAQCWAFHESSRWFIHGYFA